MWPSPVLPASSQQGSGAGRPEEYDESRDSPTRRLAVTARLDAFTFAGPAGRLEGLWKAAEGARAGSAVFAHPHPLYGGTLHSKVVFRAARCLSQAGYGVLRFNFRGVGLSEGKFDSGRGEVDDFHGALDEAERRGGTPIVAGGFSFGSAAALRAIPGDSRVCAFIGVGIPLASESPETLPLPRVPALFVVGSGDIHGPPALLRAWVGDVGRIVEIRDADHFLEGRLDELERAISAFLRELGTAAAR
jgi:alpha/beta superfamily hydrolase